MIRVTYLLIALVAGWQGQDSTQDRKILIEESFRELPPSTVKSSWDGADVVLLGAVQNREVTARRTGNPKIPVSDVTTISQLAVEEVFRGDPTLVGQVLTIQEHAGTYDAGDVILKSEDAAMEVGGRYVVFLKRGKGTEFRPRFGPHSVFAMKGGMVAPQSQAPLGRSLAGTSADQLIRELRTLRETSDKPR